MAKRNTKTIEQIDAALARWQTRLKRAVSTIERLTKQRKRAVKASAAPKPEARQEPLALTVMRSLTEPAPTPPPADTGIPAFLKRSSDNAVADQIKAEQAETKKRKAAGRIAKMKAKQSGETRRMPLTGRAALAAIRG